MNSTSFTTFGFLCGLGVLMLRCGDDTTMPDATPSGGASGATATGGVSTGGTATGGSGGSAAGLSGTGGTAGSGLSQGGAGQSGAGAGGGGQAGASGGAAGSVSGAAGDGGSSGFGGAGASGGSGGGGRAGAGGVGGTGGAMAGAGGSSAGAGGCGTTSGATFAEVKTIIGRSCGTGSCHPSAQGTHINLRDTDGMLYTRLMGNVPTTATDMQCRNRPMVVPCSPDTSLIVQMIEAADGPRAGCAIRMPDDCPGERACLPDADIQAIRSWIAAGAQQ